MNEKSLDALKQYDIDVYRVARGRGGMILATEQGVKLFLECVHPDRYYEREDMITRAVSENGFLNVDTFVRNASGELITTHEEDGRKYILKNWFEGSECSVKDISDVSAAVAALAKLHTALDEAAAYFRENGKNPAVERLKLSESYVRHMKELKLASNYLKNKKKRSEFELLAYKNIGSFYGEAVEAVKKLTDGRFDERFARAEENGELMHGSYSYHNVLFLNSVVAVTNFDKCRNECQICDLYQFMRKILEKYDWDIQVAYKMLDEYDKVKAISEKDLELLSVIFSFPDKVLKIINYYYNMNKAWIPPKSI